MSISHNGYVDKSNRKHITETQITESKQIAQKAKKTNNPPHSARVLPIRGMRPAGKRNQQSK
jgi:hypothetical protein